MPNPRPIVKANASVKSKAAGKPRPGTSSIPYTFTGVLVASTSPPIKPHLAVQVVGFSATLGTAGASLTSVELLVNGVVKTTVNLVAGHTYGWFPVAGVMLRARTDEYQVRISSAGAGASDLGGEIEVNYG